MADLFDRRAILQVGDRRIEGLRVGFTIEKKAAREPNKASIQINNLSTTTKALLDEVGKLVILEVGYREQFGAIFVGQTYRVNHEKTAGDGITTIEAADGGEDVSVAKGAWSFGKGASSAAIVRSLVAGLGVPLSTASRINPSSPTMPRGWAFAGLAADGLERITAANSLSWSIQDGQVLILDDAVVGDGVEAVLLTSGTGMIGSPVEGEADKKTKRRRFSVRCLIQPRIRPQRMVQIVSVDNPKLSGNYLVVGVKTVGDTHGGDWSMLLDLQLP